VILPVAAALAVTLVGIALYGYALNQYLDSLSPCAKAHTCPSPYATPEEQLVSKIGELLAISGVLLLGLIPLGFYLSDRMRHASERDKERSSGRPPDRP
jgi:hypothetical protein